MKPTITIITPSLNQGQFLEQTIDSVLSQGYPSLEYLIIDGGSVDNSVEIIKKYEKHLAYWVSEPDTGQSNAINKGLKRSTGEVINWLNSDDYYEPGALKIVGEVFKDPFVSAFCAKSNIVKDGNILRKSSGTDVYDSLEKTIGRARIDQPETFFRNKAYTKVGLLNEQFHFVMDREWWIRYLLEYGLHGIVKSNECIVNFRLQPNSKTVSQSNRFNIETIGIYHAIALQGGCINEANEIKNLLAPDTDLMQYAGLSTSRCQAADITNHFILHQGHEAYYMLNFELSRRFLSQVKRERLSAEDQALLRKLFFRSSLPEWLIKGIRVWK